MLFRHSCLIFNSLDQLYQALFIQQHRTVASCVSTCITCGSSHLLSLRLSASIEMSCYLHFCCRQTGSSHNSQECLRSLSVCTQLVLHGLTNETRAVIFLGNSLHSLNRPQRDLSIYTSLEPLQQRGFQNYLHHPIYLTVSAVLSWYGATLYSQQANSLIVPNLSDTMYVQPG